MPVTWAAPLFFAPAREGGRHKKASAALSVDAVEDDCLHTVDFGNGEIDMKGEREGDEIDKKDGGQRGRERGEGCAVPLRVTDGGMHALSRC